MQAIFYYTPEMPVNMAPVETACREENMEWSTRELQPAPEALRQSLPKGPAVLFLPALEKDCLGVKLVQTARAFEHGHVTVLYAPSLPDARFLCLAFREGLDDVLPLDEPPVATAVQVKRAGRRFMQRMIRLSKTQDPEGEKLRVLCERFESENAHMREQILHLSSTVGRLARGELKMSKEAPALLIAARSRAQSSSAVEIAKELGFVVTLVESGAEALAAADETPPRVLLTDGTLGDMDGAELARKMRKALGNRPLVVIAWSSSPEAIDQLLTPETLVDDFVLKTGGREGNLLLGAALLAALR